ncbi:cupin domain-containing protein [Cognatilysobacter bugurensis]|uniref:Cupin n=1 Tax=Cognatilysobacter bugurensis TaxID=543356 RepID=A0A918W4R7_9GAMM|nr:cupin domain-containing protein [Lysobacter bugurensis]GHA68631.1 cupin [Lysobacter bugurensis]
MRSKQLTFEDEFRVAFNVRDVQAAEMTLAAGDSTGGPDNTHRGADQWLFVVDGCGEALIGSEAAGRERVPLERGALLVIERGEAHEIRNTGDAPLKTLNFYYPPAFDNSGEPVGPGKSD